MPAGKHNITIEEGADLSVVVVWESGGTPVDLTGYTAAAQVRRTHDSTTTLLDFTTAIDAPAGKITLTATAEETEDAGAGFWDLKLTSAGGATRLLEGSVRFSQEVTQ